MARARANHSDSFVIFALLGWVRNIAVWLRRNEFAKSWGIDVSVFAWFEEFLDFVDVAALAFWRRYGFRRRLLQGMVGVLGHVDFLVGWFEDWLAHIKDLSWLLVGCGYGALPIWASQCNVVSFRKRSKYCGYTPAEIINASAGAITSHSLGFRSGIVRHFSFGGPAKTF